MPALINMLSGADQRAIPFPGPFGDATLKFRMVPENPGQLVTLYPALVLA